MLKSANYKLGELLVERRNVLPAQLNVALDRQRREGGRIGRHLIETGAISENDLLEFLGEQYDVPTVNLQDFAESLDNELLELVPERLARKHLVFPVSKVNKRLIVACVDPTNVVALDDVKYKTCLDVEPVLAAESSILWAIEKFYAPRTIDVFTDDEVTAAYSSGVHQVLEDISDDLEVLDEDEDTNILDLEALSKGAPVIRFVNNILVEAIHKSASDVHIESYEKRCRVRMRIDGVLSNYTDIPMKLRDGIISRLKVMSKMDIAEKRKPQDGRIRLKVNINKKEREIDFRVSCAPCLHGEKIVLRLLDKAGLRLNLNDLGFEEESLNCFLGAIKQPWGMILVTGPTGSGKTNTLYSAIGKINNEDTNIMTAEDPVEFDIEGINQVQIRENIGLTFAEALRTFLRQDPNVILIGEMRDFETAETAVKASLTGHLLFSTLHTNDAPSAINRLHNIGIEPFLISSSLNVIVAQRLVRRVCPHCADSIQIDKDTLLRCGYRENEIDNVNLKRGRGCSQCNNTGFKGRVGLFEVMDITDEIREMINIGASTQELKRAAINEGMITLRRSGLLKAARGVTTLDEVLKETSSD